MPSKYRVLTDELFYPTDPDIVRRLKAGEKIGWDARRNKSVVKGDVVEDIPSVSVPGLLKAGWIEEVKPAPAAASRAEPHSAPNTALAAEGGNS